MVYGNPKESSVGGDKGYRQPVFVIDASEEFATNDWRNARPRGVQVHNRVSCQTSVTSKVVTNSLEVSQNVAESVSEETEINISAKMDKKETKKGDDGNNKKDDDGNDVTGKHTQLGLDASLKFGNSQSFKEEVGSVDNSENSLVISEAECSVYEAHLNPFLYPAFTDAFKTSVDALPATYDENAKGIYMEFIATYGTHVITNMLMGARYGRVYTLDASSSRQFQSKTEERKKFQSASAKISASKNDDEEDEEAGKFSMSAGVENNRETTDINTESKESMLSQLASDEKLFSIGAPYNPDPNEWAADSEKDPFPIRISTHSLSDLISSHIDPSKGTNLAIALSEYRPPGAISVKSEFGKCYVETNRHVNYATYNRMTSLIAKCKPGYTAMGGTFVHLWNVHGDIKVDALATSADKLMKDLQEFHSLENQEKEVKYILSHGSDMLKKFTDGRALENLQELFGERVDPSLVGKFLHGKLNSLGLEKENFLGSINNGLKVFGKTELGKLAAEKIEKNPYANAIFSVGKNLMEKLKQAQGADVNAQTLDVGAQQSSSKMDPATKALVAQQAHTLIALFDTLDAKRGVKQAEAKPLIIGQLINMAKDIVGGLKDQIAESGGIVKHVTATLKKWKNFSGRLDDIWGLFENDIKNSKKEITSTDLYQQLLDKAMASAHGATLLETKNALSWLFPYKQNSFVCGSGNMGVKATSHSSMGYCSAFCCANDDWKMETKITHRKETNIKERTSSIVSACPGGYSVVSGGFLLSGFEEGRYMQVVTNRAEGDNSWRCTVKWTEETYNPLEPRFQCYARCARSSLAKVVCSNAQAPLVNGHGTAYCDSNMMTMSGGWDVQSAGVTYFKRTEFTDIHPVEGPRGFRCEMGTSHDQITGTCFARCCDIDAKGTEEKVIEGTKSCPHFFTLTRIQPNGDLSYVSYRSYEKENNKESILDEVVTLGYTDDDARPLGLSASVNFASAHGGAGASLQPEENESVDANGAHLRSLGNTISYDKTLNDRQVLSSRSGNYFMRFNAPKRSIEIYEEFKCEQPHRLTTVNMDPEYRCGNMIRDAREKALRGFIRQKMDEDKRRVEEAQARLRRLPWYYRFSRGFMAIFSMRSSLRSRYPSFMWRFDVNNDFFWRVITRTHAFHIDLLSNGGVDGIATMMGANRTPVLRVDRNGMGVNLVETGEECSTVEVQKDIVSRIEMMDTGDLGVFDDDGNALRVYRASACRLYYRKKGYTKDKLRSGEMMFLGDGLVSRNKEYSTLFTRAGDLAVVRQRRNNYCSRPHVKWANVKLRTDAQTDGAEPFSIRVDPAWTDLMKRSEDATVEGWILRLQDDNNLVIQDEKSNVVFETETAGMGQGKATLRLTDEGKLYIQDAVGITLWDPEYGKIMSCERLEDRLKIHSHRMGVGSGMIPGMGGLISRNKEYVLYIEEGKNGNNLEMWRSGGEDCKPTRICKLRSNVQELVVKMNGLWDGDIKLFAFEGDMPITEITLADSGHLWVHGGREHRREVSHHLKMECTAVSEQEKIDNSVCRPVAWKPGNTNWNLCPENQLLIGWDQTGVQSLTNIVSGQCCQSNVKVTCTNVDWRNAFSSSGSTVSCPPGKVLGGFFTEGSGIDSILYAKCCGPTKPEDATKNAQCYDENVATALSTIGRHTCKDGYHLTGFRRTRCNDLNCIDQFKCCQM